ncbi:5923_t:CDS:2, partial [Entrophospora sp. SA101]
MTFGSTSKRLINSMDITAQNVFYCNWKRQCGKTAEMIDLLINTCPNVPHNIKHGFHQQQQCNEIVTKKRTHDGLQTYINEHFQNFAKTLCPGYNPPSRTTLSTTLLNQEAGKVMI